MFEGTKPYNPNNWVNAPTLESLKKDLSSAETSSSHLSKMTRWMDLKNGEGKAAIKKIKGRSTVVPKLVRKQAEWRYPEFSEPFLDNSTLFDVHPVTWEDELAAKQTKLLLNNQFNRLDKVALVDEIVRDFVDTGTVIVRVAWEFKEQTVTEEVPEVVIVPSMSPELPEVYQRIDGLIQSGSDISKLPEPVARAYAMYQKTGVPHKPLKIGMKLEKRTKVLFNRPTLTVCDHTNIIIDPTCKGKLSDAKFIVNKFRSNLGELTSSGLYNNLDKVLLDSEGISEHLNQEDYEEYSNNFVFEEDTRKNLDVFEYWGYYDINGTKELTPVVITWVGLTIIRMEENPYPDKKLPFLSAAYLPTKNSIYGEPDAELLEDSQAVLGATLRGIIDVMGRSAVGQVGTRKDALDIANRKKFDNGLNYQYNGNSNPNDIFHMHTYPEIPASAMNLLTFSSQEAESLTGIKAFNTGITGNSLGDSATGIRGVLDATSKRKLGILRRLGSLFTDVGRKFISMNAVFLSDEEVIRVTNDKFITVRRDDLEGNIDLELTISTAEEDSVKAQEIAFMVQTLGNSVDPAITRMLLADIARLRKNPLLAKKLEEYEPTPDPLAEQKAMLEIKLLEAQIFNETAKGKENEANAEYDLAKAAEIGSNIAINKTRVDKANLDYVEQDTGVHQQRHLETIKAQAQGNIDLKNTEHINNLVERTLEPKMENKP